MATYATSAGDIALHAKVTTANTVDTLTLTGYRGPGEIISNGADELYYTVDGSTPTVGGNNTYRLPAGAISSRVFLGAVAGADTIVKVKSAGIVTYSVQAI